MSVPTPDATPPATSQVAAAVAALLNSGIAPADSGPAPAAAEVDTAESPGPRRLLGPSGLGAPALRINLPTLETLAAIAEQAAHPSAPAGGVTAPAAPPAPATEKPARGPIALGPTGIGSGSAYRRTGLSGGSRPVATAPADPPAPERIRRFVHGSPAPGTAATGRQSILPQLYSSSP